MSDSPAVFCVGWVPETAAVDLWHPDPPESYVKQETKDNWVRKTMSKAPLLPFVGRPGEISVLNAAGELVLELASPAEFLEFADKHGKFSSMPQWGEAPEPNAIFIGLNLKELFASAAAALWRCEGIKVPKRFWRHPPGLVEIYETLVPGRGQ